jgi:hypothetical protein
MNHQWVEEYISSLTPHQQEALRIARSHLESSFDVLRSNGFKEFLKEKEKEKEREKEKEKEEKKNVR